MGITRMDGHTTACACQQSAKKKRAFRLCVVKADSPLPPIHTMPKAAQEVNEKQIKVQEKIERKIEEKVGLAKK